MPRHLLPAESVAEAYLALLSERGIERLFINAGTDFAPIVEAYRRRGATGLRFPDIILCGHENLAVSMAHGAFLGDGKIPAVMLHTSVGTANAVCATFSAARARIPLLITAGRTPLFEAGVLGSRTASYQWGQEMYDQAGMLREFVKWEYELRDGLQVEQVVDRALDVALTEPSGPVYLTLPREVLAARVNGVSPSVDKSARPTAAFPSPAAVAELAERMVSARLPVIVTSATGVDQATVPLLNELCSRFAVAVAERDPRYVNVAADHPLHLGHEMGPVLAEADLLCFLDVDVPWLPGDGEPQPGAFVVHCGIDPHFHQYPMRSHRSDLSITGSSVSLIRSLTDALSDRADRIPSHRRRELAERADVGAAKREAANRAEGNAVGPISKDFMNLALSQVLPPEAVIVNEYWGRPDILARSKPGTYFGSPPAGGLGWGLPAALGIQLARRDATVIATIGDGAYLFANPAVCHHAMEALGLPVLTVICRNAKWGAVERSLTAMYPASGGGDRDSRGGDLTREVGRFSDLNPLPDFEGYARASGGYAESVSERNELIPALARALVVVENERRHAVVICDCE